MGMKSLRINISAITITKRRIEKHLSEKIEYDECHIDLIQDLWYNEYIIKEVICVYGIKI